MHFVLIVTCIKAAEYLLKAEGVTVTDDSLPLYNASQSSTQNSGADLAIDRDLSTFIHTKHEQWNWFQVSLGSRNCVSIVTVINRPQGCCIHRFGFHHFTLLI